MGILSKRTTAWCAVTIAVVLVMAGAALGQYEGPPRVPLEEELLYQENINMEPELRAGAEGIEKSLMLDKELNKALILDKIMQGVQMKSENPEDYPGTISETTDYLDFTRKMPGTIHTKDMVTKRFADSLKQREIRNGGNTSTPPQRRWKTKKGTQIMCYFKLCSFRLPS